jgi:glucokinase
VGVGFPGAVDAAAGTVGNASNLPGFEDTVPLADALRSSLGVPVSLGNDVTVATSAEGAIGAGRGYRSLLGVFWGTGVGGGLILDGRPWVGRGTAGEFGHMVVKRDGARCTCGRLGCVEAYAGRASMEARARRRVEHGEHTVLFELMEERGKPRLTSGIWAHALQEGDKLAEEIVDRAVAALGAGIGSAQNLLDLEAVIVGGGLGSRLGEPYLERIREATMPHLFVDTDPPALRLAELGDLGGALGAALLVDA